MLLAAMSCLILSISASPIQIVEKSKEVKVAPVEKSQARQNEGPAAAAEEDDDDDDGEFLGPLRW